MGHGEDDEAPHAARVQRGHRPGEQPAPVVPDDDGVPLTERDGGYAGMVMPDRITLYRIPICAMCRTEAEVVEVVRDTVIHEVAHHFGIDDERLDELGWA